MTGNYTQIHQPKTMRIILFSLLLLSIISCTESSPMLSQLHHIDSLMNDDPQAAYDSLCSIKKGAYASLTEKELRKWQMLDAKAKNKLYLQMPDDSMFMEVADYYKRHGSDNEKMESMYLMGCIYRDKEEAAKALDWYITATECADTLDTECDYSTLFRIYGQIAGLLANNNLYKEAMSAHSNASRFAFKAGDIYEAIHAKELVGGDYYALGDTLKSLAVAKECIALYEKHNMKEAAAAAVPLIMYTHIVYGQYDSAHYYMQKFEKQGGLFNNGFIKNEREYYYFIKGLYYYGVDRQDSAELYFRKAISRGFRYDGYRGLALVYKEQNIKDSIIKFTELAQQSLENDTETNQSNEIITAIKKHELEKEKQSHIFRFVICIIISTILTLVAAFRSKMKFLKAYICKKTVEDTEIDGSTETSLPSESCIYENMELEKHIEQEKGLPANLNEEERFVMIHLQDNISPFKKHLPLSKKEWKLIFEMMERYKPYTYEFLTLKHSLSDKELQVCFLTCLGFTSGNISKILDLSSQRISNIKSSSSKKLFGTRNARVVSQKFQD